MKGLMVSLAIVLMAACGASGQTAVGMPLTINALKFTVMDSVGTPVYCDPDFYPVARAGSEQASAVAQYPQIRAQPDLYAAIVAHEHLPLSALNDAQKLTVYRAYKLLNALALTQNGNDYAFDLIARKQGAGSIQRVKGTVRIDGVVTLTSTTPSGPPPCPICLAASTLIATPGGDVRVTDLVPGMTVWTATRDGERVAVKILEIGSTPVPATHLMVSLRLADGRALLASPGHRLADGRQLGEVAVGQALDGSTISQWELVPYGSDRTYDLLPAGPTGTYWADGILLSTTLRVS
jgi:hypothetical protein